MSNPYDEDEWYEDGDEPEEAGYMDDGEYVLFDEGEPMNEQERIQQLAQRLDGLTHDWPQMGFATDINEIMGIYDGHLMLIQEAWDELRKLLDLKRDGFDDNPPSPTEADDHDDE